MRLVAAVIFALFMVFFALVMVQVTSEDGGESSFGDLMFYALVLVVAYVLLAPSLLFGPPEVPEQDDQSLLYQDIAFVRLSTLTYGRTREGHYTDISIGALVDVGLLTKRFGCAGTAATTGAALAAATTGCGKNPLNSAWLLEGVPGKKHRYRLVIAVDSSHSQLAGQTVSDFYDTVKNRLWTESSNGGGGYTGTALVDVRADQNALTIVFQP